MLHESVALGTQFLTRHDAAVGVDNHFAVGQKFAGHLLGGVEVAATVELEVENEVLHALLLQFLDFVVYLLARSGPEAVELDVACGGGDEVGRVDGVERNFVAHDFKVQHVFGSAAHNVEAGNGALGAAQERHDAVAVHFYPRNGAAVDGDDAVAFKYTRLLARPFADNLQHEERVFVDVETYPDAFEVSGERFGEFARFLGVGVGRVRVELAEYAVDGIFNEFFLVDTVDIKTGNGDLCHLQFFELVDVDVVVRAAVLCADREGEQQREQQ